jgi:hypothetical protein
MCTKFWSENLKERDALIDQGVEDNIQLRYEVWQCGRDSPDQWHGSMDGSFKYGNKPGSMQVGVFLHQLSDYSLLKDSTPWT